MQNSIAYQTLNNSPSTQKTIVEAPQTFTYHFGITELANIDGYCYLKLFHPELRDEVATILGQNPNFTSIRQSALNCIYHVLGKLQAEHLFNEHLDIQPTGLGMYHITTGNFAPIEILAFPLLPSDIIGTESTALRDQSILMLLPVPLFLFTTWLFIKPLCWYLSVFTNIPIASSKCRKYLFFWQYMMFHGLVTGQYLTCTPGTTHFVSLLKMYVMTSAWCSFRCCTFQPGPLLVNNIMLLSAMCNQYEWFCHAFESAPSFTLLTLTMFLTSTRSKWLAVSIAFSLPFLFRALQPVALAHSKEITLHDPRNELQVDFRHLVEIAKMAYYNQPNMYLDLLKQQTAPNV